MKLSKLEIVKESIFKEFQKGEPFCCYGLLVKATYDDGSEEFVTEPYIEIPDFNLSGAYLVKIYKSKEEKEISIAYYVAYSNYKNGEVKGIFMSNKDIKLFSFKDENKKENIIPIYLTNNPSETETMFLNKWGGVYSKKLVDVVLSESQKQGLNIIFKEL